MKNKDKYYSIRFKIFIVFAILLLLTCLSVFVFFTYQFNKVYKQQADSHMADVTSLSAENVSNKVEQIDQLSVSVIVDRVVQENLEYIKKYGGDDTGGMLTSKKAAVSAQIRGSVFNIKGIISLRIYSVGGDEIFIGTTNREYLEYSMTGDQIYEANGAALWGSAGEDRYLCMGRAILSTADMTPLGYMVIVCKNDYFSSELTTVSSSYSSKLYLVDEGNTVVASGAADTIGNAFPYTVSELREPGISTIQDPGSGESSYFYIGPDMGTGWTLIATVSKEQFQDSIFLAVLQMGLMICAALILSLILTAAAVKKLVGPTQKLLKSMNAFGGGKLDARVETRGNDEIGQIGQTYNQMADNIQNLMEKVYSLEIANKEAEIEFLKMQINPHFLYNSLDTISWLGFMNGNEDVSELAVALAKLLRASIKRADMITVDEEMQIVRNYLRIQSFRFGDKISVECDVEEQVLCYFMPSFLLQPLIENSIIHGLEGLITSGTLRVCVREQVGYVCFAISDNGTGMNRKQVELLTEQCRDVKSNNSIGLKNVYRRLQLLYGPSCEFEIKSAPGEGTKITFRIPVIKERKGTGSEP